MYIHRIINSVFTSNTYILTSEGQSAFLIDIGDVQPVKELLDNDGKVVKAVFLTHTHYDHIYFISADDEADLPQLSLEADQPHHPH